MKLCILAAGFGTRNTTYKNLHKALLPIENKSAIGLIIENTPKDWEIIIAVGHLADQIKTYISYVFPDRNIRFVHDLNPKSPEGSLMCCKDYLNGPFIFTSVDTILSENFTPVESDWLGVDKYNTVSYDAVLGGLERINVPPIFIGTAGIFDTKSFWNNLDKEKSFRNIFREFKLKVFTWKDIGSDSNYKSVNPSVLSLPKTNQTLYSENGKIVKWFESDDTASNLMKRADIKNFPLVLLNENMVGYERIEGELLTDCFNTRIFDCLENSIVNLDLDISLDCKEMYQDKTYQRVEKLLGGKDDEIYSLLSKIDWDDINNNYILSEFHGDFQPENIIVTDTGIVPIDWRETFGGQIQFGDLYYDLAKFHHACLVSNRIIQEDRYEINPPKIDFIDNLMNYHDQLELFCIRNDISWKKVCILSALQYISIAVLYDNNKYREFLFQLGKSLLHVLLEEDNDYRQFIKTLCRRVESSN